MIALAASRRPSGDARAKSASSTPSNFDASSGSPITPVEARKISFAGAPVALAASAAVSFAACAPALPVNALALPELTMSARALPALSLARHQSTGADGHFDFVKTPATSRALVENRQHHVGAILVTDTGRARGESHALDLRQVGKRRWRERRRAAAMGGVPKKTSPWTSQGECRKLPRPRSRRQGMRNPLTLFSAVLVGLPLQAAAAPISARRWRGRGCAAGAAACAAYRPWGVLEARSARSSRSCASPRRARFAPFARHSG